MFPNDSLLRTALLANGVFSGLSALVMVSAADSLGRVLGTVDPSNLYLLGGGLALFAVALLLQARSETIDPKRAMVATFADLAWVGASAMLWIAPPDSLSEAGLVIVAVVAVIVLALAALQLVGLARYARNRRGATEAPSMFQMTHRFDAPSERVWEQIRVLDRIGEFYEELESVEVVETDGGTVRTCVDGDGRRWSEEVLELDGDEGSLTLRFVTEAGDFPFPMTTMVGGWEVAPADHGAEVTLWYEYTPKGGVFGEILAALMTPALEERMTPVLRNLEATAAAGGSVRPQSV